MNKSSQGYSSVHSIQTQEWPNCELKIATNPIICKGKRNMQNKRSKNKMHFLFVGGVLKLQLWTSLQYILNINVNMYRTNPKGTKIFSLKNIVWGQEFFKPSIKEINKKTNEIRLKIDILYNNCNIVNL